MSPEYKREYLIKKISKALEISENMFLLCNDMNDYIVDLERELPSSNDVLIALKEQTTNFDFYKPYEEWQKHIRILDEIRSNF